MTREKMLQAIARGWCRGGNEGQALDPDLAAAIVDELWKDAEAIPRTLYTAVYRRPELPFHPTPQVMVRAVRGYEVADGFLTRNFPGHEMMWWLVAKDGDEHQRLWPSPTTALAGLVEYLRKRSATLLEVIGQYDQVRELAEDMIRRQATEATDAPGG